jgi:hypothetical protein
MAEGAYAARSGTKLSESAHDLKCCTWILSMGVSAQPATSTTATWRQGPSLRHHNCQRCAAKTDGRDASRSRQASNLSTSTTLQHECPLRLGGRSSRRPSAYSWQRAAHRTHSIRHVHLQRDPLGCCISLFHRLPTCPSLLRCSCWSHRELSRCFDTSASTC